MNKITSTFRIDHTLLCIVLIGAVSGCVGTATNPITNTPSGKGRFEGSWQEEKALVGSEFRPQNPQQPIQLLEFHGNKFRLVWRPFERYHDYWGVYTPDKKNGTIVFRIEYGNFIPKDFVGKGTYSFDDRGRLILKGVWFGTPSRGTVSGDFQGHIFVNERALKTTPLHKAAESGNTDVLQKLINDGQDINQKDEHGMTPLHLAASQGRTEAVKLLLSNGAETDAKSRTGETPLELAARSGKPAIVALLIREGTGISARGGSFQILLHLLLSRRHLIEDEYVSVPTSEEDDIANTAELLISKGANPKDSALLLLAADQSLAKVVQLLLMHGANANSRDSKNYTPLHCAAVRGNTEIMKLLLDSGADIHAKGGDTLTTPLHEAIHYDWAGTHVKPVVQLLVDRGADVNAKDRNGVTPLHKAYCGRDEVEVAELLLNKGAHINAKGGEAQRTPLHEAADTGDWNISIVNLLLNRGAEVNEIDDYGNTPLHLAAEVGAVQVVKLLIQKSAKVQVKNKDGKTPLDLAKSKNRDRVIAFLQSLSANPER